MAPSVLAAQAQPPAPARPWFCPGICPAIPVHLLKPAPKITWPRTHLSPCFCHQSGQNFSSPSFIILESHLWSMSMPLSQIPFLSSWYRKGRPELWLHSRRGICFVKQSVSHVCRTWQVKPLRSACTGTVQGLEKGFLLHCHHPALHQQLLGREET